MMRRRYGMGQTVAQIAAPAVSYPVSTTVVMRGTPAQEAALLAQMHNAGSGRVVQALLSLVPALRGMQQQLQTRRFNTFPYSAPANQISRVRLVAYALTLPQPRVAPMVQPAVAVAPGGAASAALAPAGASSAQTQGPGGGAAVAVPTAVAVRAAGGMYSSPGTPQQEADLMTRIRGLAQSGAAAWLNMPYASRDQLVTAAQGAINAANANGGEALLNFLKSLAS